jgi:hypothetical protein
VQHRLVLSDPGSLHNLSIIPITSYPAATIKAAATELSTPPLIATATLAPFSGRDDELLLILSRGLFLDLS